MKKQNGFTLIELVVVMVILGILAAVAIPKFVDMTSQARAAKAQGAYGAVRSAMMLTHANSLAKGEAANATSTITAEGSTINMVYGYPAATVAVATPGGIALAAGLNPGTTPDYTIALSGANVTITVPGATTPGSCLITYIPAADAATPAKADLVTTGC